MKKLSFLPLFVLIILSSEIKAQKQQINWITFEQLEDSLAHKPKKVFISFTADWCVFCKKMEKTAFKNKNIISILNKEYYAIKMNAESKDTIVFEGVSYTNTNIDKSRRPTHQIPLLLATRKNIPFSLPVQIILDEKFQVIERYFEYLSPKKLIKILSE